MKARVALLAGTLGRGGAEKQLVATARALARAGLDVSVLSLTSGEPHEAGLRDAGVPVTPALGSRPAKLGRLVSELVRFRPHVVQSGHTYANLYAAVAGRAAGALTLGALRSSLGHSQRANGAWTRWHLSAPHGLVVNSFAAERELRSSRIPVYVVPNAVEAEETPAAPRADGDGCVVAFVGRLIAAKRVDLFLEAIAAARRSIPRVRGLVVGDGPARAAAEERALSLGLLPRHVTFLGERSDVPALLRTADMLLLSSDEEGFPNVLLEAMAAGLPVVTRPAGDAAAVVKQGETGFVVPGGAEELAERVALLARAPELRRRMGEQGRRRALDEYGIGKLCSRLLAVYRDLAGRCGRVRTLDALS